MEELNVAKEKCTKIFAELDSEKGYGLVVRKRQGLGKPDKLYVMNFFSSISVENDENDAECFMSETSESESSEFKTQEVRKSEVQKFENRTSGVSENVPQEVRKSNINNNDINNYTEIDHIYPIISNLKKESDVIDEIEEYEEYRQLISKNIEYEFLTEKYSQNSADGILETMFDAVCSNKEYLIVSGAEIPQMVVKSRLLKLKTQHVEYVLECLKKNTKKVYNIKSYLLTALYNLFSTIDHYYRAEVNHNFYGCN